jgi:hypothetical protein
MAGKQLDEGPRGFARLVVVENGPDGRSRVVSDGPPISTVLIAPGPDALTAHRSTLAEPPGEVQPGEALVAELDQASMPALSAGYSPPENRRRSLDLPPGGTRWSSVTYGQDVDVSIHETATVDYDLVMSGSVVLVLDSGDVILNRGDAVVLRRARHGWRSGPDGCVLAIVMNSLL